MTEPNIVNAIAARLRDAEATRQTVAPVRGEIAIDDIATAYAVQQANVDVRIAQGERIVGRKIGLTSLAVQKQLGVDQPDFGVLFADMEYVSGMAVPVSTLIQPKAEGEVAFVMGKDLEGDLTWGRFLSAIEYALPAIEIVDSAIQDWRITLVDTVADNASCGLYVLGADPKRLTDVILPECGMRFLRNGETSSEGSGAACLGHPLNAAWWLANTMLKAGAPLRAGDVVLSGALGPMFPIKAGEALQLEVEGLGRVNCQTE